MVTNNSKDSVKLPTQKHVILGMRSYFVDMYQFFWFMTHLNTLLGFFMYSIWLFAPEKKFLSYIPWYSVAIYNSILTYSIVIYKRYLCKDKLDQEEIYGSILISYILKTENVHLIINAFLWTVTEKSVFKLLPFAIYSILNISYFFVFEVFPTSSFSIAFSPFVEYIKSPALILSAFFDIFVMFILIKESYFKNSYYALVCYTFIWALKMENSDACRVALFQIMRLFNCLIKQKYVPSKVKQFWFSLELEFCQLLSISNEEVSQNSEIIEGKVAETI